jgi:hypothetical protein
VNIVSPQVQAQCRGKRAIIVGGDPRNERLPTLKAAFGFDSLEWAPSGNERRVGNVVARMEGGGVDLIIALKGFIEHKVALRLRSAKGNTPIVWADTYSVTSIAGALAKRGP